MSGSKIAVIGGALAVVIIAGAAYAYSAKQASDRNSAKMAQIGKMQTEAKMKSAAMKATPTPTATRDAMMHASPSATPDAMKPGA